MSSSRPTLRYQAHLRTPSPDPDAGLRDLSHYERRLPKWRHQLRQWLIPIVRAETPYLARMQDTFRSPWLDSYFALTANLGTHTCFMTALPICFWCGYPALGIALIHMLAAGVYLSGYVKDLVCLPRPLSPPLHRITMSGSAALEYGFPSTHTTNAVSVALFCLHELWQSKDQFSPGALNVYIALTLGYAISISVGRMYCGMHGFSDVAFGLLLGILITFLRLLYGPFVDGWIMHGDWTRPLIVAIVMAIGVRFHPEPADNCPCFDDSVAFLGVITGVSGGLWHYASMLSQARGMPLPLSDMYGYTNQDLIKSFARVIGGIVVIFLWRAAMKPLLLRILPPLYRFVSHWGLAIPRRYFLQSRDYTRVPDLRQDDQVLPTAAEIPSMLSTIRHRKRTISIGPQSEADAREYIANREQLRREAMASNSLSPTLDLDQTSIATPAHRSGLLEVSSAVREHSPMRASSNGISGASLEVNAAVERAPLSPSSPLKTDSTSDESKHDEDRKLFSALERPRIRYDVEVITKLVVYAGIGWITVEGDPLLFRLIGIA